MASRSRTRAKKKYWKSILRMFVLYAVIIPLVYFLLDSKLFVDDFTDDPFWFVVKLLGAAFAISYVINTWLLRDPELRRW